MVFEDRKDAGKRLSRALESYRSQDVSVLAIPRGGTEVGFEVARHLDARFSLLVTRKLPLPDNPETGFGAVAEDGSSFFVERVARSVPEEVKEKIVQEQKQEVERRVEKLRGEHLPDLKGETVMLVDDGIAMGSTMKASIKMCKNQGAGRIGVAVPVCSPKIAEDLEEEVDEFVVLEKPRFFQAVAQVYRHWRDIQDEEVLEIMRRWRERQEMEQGT